MHYIQSPDRLSVPTIYLHGHRKETGTQGYFGEKSQKTVKEGKNLKKSSNVPMIVHLVKGNFLKCYKAWEMRESSVTSLK